MTRRRAVSSQIKACASLCSRVPASHLLKPVHAVTCSELKPAAWLNGDGSVRATFVYGLHANVPEYMVQGGTTYRLIADQVGSVRLVENTSMSAVAERIDYDEFGNVLTDTTPGTQPFGFAGGLRDPTPG